MKQIKGVYRNNSVLRFLISYVLILILPLVALLYGFNTAFQVVEKDIKQSSIFVLEHGIARIDEDVKALRGIALQMSQSANLQDFGTKRIVNSDYTKQAFEVMEEYNNSMRYQGISMIENNYIYFKKRDIVLFENSLYHTEIFKQYLSDWNLTLTEWKNMCNNKGSRKPIFYVTSGGNIQYVMPFANDYRSSNLGALVYVINQNVIRNYLNFLDDYKEYSIFIMNTDGSVIFSEDKLSYSNQIKKEWLKGNGTADTEQESIIYSSSTAGWQYILVLPKQVALQRLTQLESLVTILILSTISIGFIISLFLSLHQGRPINALFDTIKSAKNQSEQQKLSFQNMGEIVTEILRNNRSLLEEQEHDKPLLLKAFLHNLIKGEFVNTAELNYMAKKAGIELSGHKYCVISFKIFSNNDFYEVDEQTLEEVRIITQLVMNHILENYEEAVWFYKRNTQITLGIFTIKESSKKIEEVIEETFDWLMKEYSVETDWGISNFCNSLIGIWKNCEEATVAMEACQDSRHIIRYSYGLEKAEEFYFPYIVEEKIVSAMKSGDFVTVEAMLKLLEEENFIHRSLDRTRLIKFNRRMTELLSQKNNSMVDLQEKILWLNEKVIYFNGQYIDYMERLTHICKEICIFEQQNKTDHRKQIISEIKVYINNNYMDSGLGLGKVGSEFGMSEGYLSTIFKEGAGINFAEYLEQIRIDTACELLKDANNSVCQVGELVGYNSIQSFRRAFKRVKGVSPKEFRE